MTDWDALPPGIAERLGLYRVRAGSSLAELAAVRPESQGESRTLAYPAFDEATPSRVGFNVGVTFGLWGVSPDGAGTLGELAEHLVVHTLRVIRSHHIIVTTTLDAGRATVSVIGLRGRRIDGTHPGEVEAVRTRSHTCGYLALPAGPGVVASVDLSVGREGRS
ncbi:hypothetical protein ACIHCQ_10425 [Streptomyces sp. NPDC052236]|uniref:hypothetical protein n=1 Tax=Streptomyces sp. NPDC052236 TaxID=3365686 RepID=UPI0037D4136B